MTALRHRVNFYMSNSFAVLTFHFVLSEQWVLLPSYYIYYLPYYHYHGFVTIGYQKISKVCELVGFVGSVNFLWEDEFPSV